MSHETLIETAQKMWEKQWKAVAPTDASAAAPRLRASVMAALVDLVAENPTRPVEELMPIVHRVLFETQFVDDAGDSAIFNGAKTLELQTKVMVDVLDQVRRYGLREGLWSSLPATPMMYG